MGKHSAKNASAMLAILSAALCGVLWRPAPEFHNSLTRAERPPVDTSADMSLFLEKQQLAAKDTNMAARTITVAKSFLRTPYVTGCLDRDSIENLVVNLRELDCWTFVENSLAIALAYNGDFDTYQHQLQQLRYWNGEIDGYGSRIHYMTGWLLQAQERGILQDITADLGGIPWKKNIDYISARPARYPKTRDSKVLQDVKNAEERINAQAWYYIPKNKIARIEHLIREGDIIGLVSVKPDLDFAHQGFAVQIKGRIHLLNASSLAGKVAISRQPLSQYIAAQRGQSGIMVARLK